VQYKKYAPQAQLVMMARSGHYPFVEESEQFFSVLRHFLDTALGPPIQH